MIKKPLPSFARRIARALRPRQERLMSELLPTLKFELTPTQSPKMLEIGFGNGDHLLDFAIKHPDFMCYGAEPFINGVGSLLVKLEDTGITNIRIHNDDIRPVIDKTPLGFFDCIYIICPDPWPKRRQLKRRLINPEFLKALKKVLSPQGTITMVTDHKDYAGWILKAIIAAGEFTIPSTNLIDYTEIPAEFIQTKYQRKGIEKGYQVHYFCIG
ncbi:MAG: tRNA (guanosine(46)-N7)-methyltransferase TrmB [Rickettsiales bacterium]